MNYCYWMLTARVTYIFLTTKFYLCIADLRAHSSGEQTAKPRDPATIQTQIEGLLELHNLAYSTLTRCNGAVQLLELDATLLDTLVRRPGPHPRRSDLLVALARTLLKKFGSAQLLELSDGFLLRLETLDRWRDSGECTRLRIERHQLDTDIISAGSAAGFDGRTQLPDELYNLGSPRLVKYDILYHPSLGARINGDGTRKTEFKRGSAKVKQIMVDNRDIALRQRTPLASNLVITANSGSLSTHKSTKKEAQKIYAGSKGDPKGGEVSEILVVSREHIKEVIPFHHDQVAVGRGDAGKIEVVEEGEVVDPDWEDENDGDDVAPSRDPRLVTTRGEVSHKTVPTVNKHGLPQHGRFVGDRMKRERWLSRVCKLVKKSTVGRKSAGKTMTPAKKRENRLIQRRAMRYKGLAKRYKKLANKGRSRF